MIYAPHSARDDLLTAPWWSGEGDVAAKLFAAASYLAGKLKGQHDAAWLHYMLYSREDARAMGAPMRARPDEMRRPMLTLNVVRAVIQTVQAQIIKGKIRPQFLTSGADFRKQQAIKKVDAFCQGAMYHARIDDLAPEASLHALVTGTGILKCTTDSAGKPSVDLKMPQELLFDNSDGARRRPRTLYQVSAVARDALLADPRYKAKESLIKDAGLPRLSDACCAWQDSLVDQVTVVEAWHLPSAPDAGDGRHVVAMDNGTLLDEPWIRGSHPFVFLRWEQRASGMYGTGICQDLRGIQFELNRILTCIQEQMMLAGPKVFVQRGSHVNTSDITNRIWDVIEYTGAKPEYSVFQTVSPEMFQQVESLYQKAFDVVGVSIQASRGEKASGVTSGTAIQAVADMQTGRMVGYAQRYERMHVDLATTILDEAFAQTTEPGGDDDSDGAKGTVATDTVRDLSLTYPARNRLGQSYLGQIKRSDVTLSRDEYVVEVWPVNLLSNGPEAKLQQVMQMKSEGVLNQQESRYLLDFPDLQSMNATAYAPLEAILTAIDDMLIDGKPRMPEQWTDLAQAVPLVGAALQRAQVEGVPEDHWTLCGNYLTAALAQQKAQLAEQQAAQAPAGGPPGLPPGAPMPMPPGGPPGAAGGP